MFPVFNILRVVILQRCAAAKERRGKTAKQAMTDNNVMALNRPAGTAGGVEGYRGKGEHAW